MTSCTQISITRRKRLGQRPVNRVRAAFRRLSRDRYICPAELVWLLPRLCQCAAAGYYAQVQSRVFGNGVFDGAAYSVGIFDGYPIIGESQHLFEAVRLALFKADRGACGPRTHSRILVDENKSWAVLPNGMPVEFVVLQALAKERNRYSYVR